MPRAANPPRPSEGLPDAAPCPFCDQRETQLLNPFGGQLSVAQYWCRRCRTGFDYIKWEDSPGELH
jgi:hypothetical protein